MKQMPLRNNLLLLASLLLSTSACLLYERPAAADDARPDSSRRSVSIWRIGRHFASIGRRHAAGLNCAPDRLPGPVTHAVCP